MSDAQRRARIDYLNYQIVEIGRKIRKASWGCCGVVQLAEATKKYKELIDLKRIEEESDEY